MEICLSFMLKRRPTASPSTAWKDPNSTTPSPSLGGFRKALNSVVSTKDAGGFGPKRGESLIATIGAPGESEEPLYTSELVSAAAISAEEGDSAVASPASVCLHFSLHACLDAQQSKAVSICLWQTNAKHGQRSLDAGRRLLLSRAVLQLHEICLLGGRQHVVMPMSVTDRLCLFDVDAIVWRLPPLALGGGALSLEQGDSSGVAHNVHSPFNPMSDTFTFARMGASSHKSTPAAPMDLLSGIDIFTGPASPNPSSQYSDLDLVVIQDICVEPKSTVQLPLQLLSNLQISLKAAADAWARRLQVEKARQGFFPTDKAAIEAGRVIVHAYVAGARGLRDVVGSRNDDSSAEEQCSSPQSPTTPPLQDASPDARDQSGSGSAGSRNRKIFSDVKKFGGRAVAIARNATQANVKASVLGHGDRQLKRSNFFVVVSQGGRPRSRTNTEYCTNSPEWGSNENKSACLHNTPKLLPSVIGPGILELASGPNVPDGAVGCRFYVPQSDVAQGTVQLDLYQEVYTLRGGIREERIGSACAPLQGIASNPPTHPLDLWLPVTPSKPWPPLPTFEPPVTPAIHVQLSLQHDYDATLGEESRLTGTMEADPLSGADSESDESSDSEGEERQHDDVQALPELTLAANLASQPASVTRAQCYEWMTVLSQPDDVLDIALLRSLYDSVEFPVPFCHSHAQAMARSHARVARMCSVLWQMQRQGKQFRSSLDKKHRDLQCIPTNLHVQLMVVDDGVQASPSVYDFITVGAPTAHALGYKKGGLLSLASAQSVLKQNIISLKQQQPLDEAALVQLSMQLEMSSLTLALRRAVVTSQVLGIAAAAFATKLELMSHGLLEGAVTAVRGWLAVGFIIGFEGLLSTQGKEHGMVEDTVASLEILRSYSFRLEVLAAGSSCFEVSVIPAEHVIRVGLIADILPQLPPELRSLPVVIPIEAVLFTQGIDIQQTVSNQTSARRRGAFQAEVNDANFARLREYSILWQKATGAQPSGGSTPLASLREAIQSQLVNAKNTAVLLESEAAVRGLKGARVTFCKSGKDRTAMSVTLEQAILLKRNHLAAATGETTGTLAQQTLPVANLLRAHGTRIKVACKNIGYPKYSFNAIQRQFIPELYKAPAGTIQDIRTSFAKRDS